MLNDIRVFLFEALETVPAVLMAIVLHEYFHGLAAYMLGDDTAKRAGRLTLNPLKHLDPIGTLALIFFHFGWARPVPISFWKLRNPRRDMVIVSLAGPIANLVTGFIAEFIYIRSDLFLYARYAPILPLPTIVTNPYMSYFADAFGIFIYISYVLFVFNLIPIPPLDGSKVLDAFLPSKYMNWILKYEIYGTIILFVLILLGVVYIILNPAVNWLVMNSARLFVW
ncbi:site-2 protease family protein [Athalassotoga saccharophila]|uniref:site-2 protease family protein n=1 Tax=Athalassotoga saccharophila TaxID=1441386 RepID=UPI00137B5927|nr:site-2 protease family protein [Athalassotoga saccharophila]BBJ28838.1 membrane metalloprotease [Athalassotoga saccharophila]